MKKLFYLVLAAVLFAVGCSESFDDSKIWDKLDDHESRISQLEELCKQMNTNISSLQTLVEAWNAQDYVTNVKMALDEDNQVIGYIITFKKSGSITIYHGKDGQNGTNGTTPIINVKKDSDGIFYWTLNGEWLLDDNGHKIKAVGTDGKDGQNGTDGEDGQDGATGPQGPVGEDGITPQFKIEDDYWHISYDNGRSWQKLNKAIGEDGENGKDGDSFFQDVDSSNEDYIIFTLTNGTQLKIPTWAAYEKLQALCNQMNTNITSLQAIVDALNKKDYIASVSPFDQEGEEAGYKISFTSGKTITIYHGKNGQNGEDGKDGIDGEDGEDGKDGSTPIIGVKLFNGVYYWTLNGEWLLDDDGNKIKAIGTDGEDGKDGQDGATGPQGPAGENGEDGKDGENGKDGITPKLKIENGKWFVSYDEGESWKEVGQATGDKGEQGPQGDPGVGGDSMFTNIDYTTSTDYVVFTLSNGTAVKLPTWTAFEKLQTLCNQMNTNIASLQTIIDAMQNNDYVKSITPIMENGKEIGYTITFSKSGTVTINHGKDGQNGAAGENGTDGEDGEDGKDGQDGSTPVIGVKQFEGIYYWTVNGEWLLDENGNKIKAQGQDGSNGQNGAAGEDGTDGEDGEDGEDGADGKDGITPKLKIENGKWYVSYNKGVSWTLLGQATGEQGPQGPQGEAGNSFFKSVTQDENYVTFTLSNGTEFSILKASTVSSVKISYIPRYDDGKATVTYTSIADSSIEMDFQVMPTSVATIIAKDWRTTLSLKAVETQTRAVEYIDMPISKCTADATNGTITITASGKNLPAKFFSGAANIRAALFYNTAISGTVSEYVELVALANKILYTATAKVEPYATDVFGANIVSNTWNSKTGKGVITFDGDITEIGNRAFYGCSSLTSITIPESVTTIGKSTFANCTSLTSITIASNIAEIGYYAFGGCSSLTAVYCRSTTPPYARRFQDTSTRAANISTTIPGGSSVSTNPWSAFSDNHANRLIYVPYEARTAYQSADGWKDYANYIVSYTSYDLRPNDAWKSGYYNYYIKPQPLYQTYANGEFKTENKTKALAKFSIQDLDLSSVFDIVEIDYDGSYRILSKEEIYAENFTTKFEFVDLPADSRIKFINNTTLSYNGLDDQVRIKGRLYRNGIEMATSFDDVYYSLFEVHRFAPLCTLSINSSAPKAFEITEATRYVINVLDFFDLYESRDGSGYPYIWEDGSKVNLIDHSTGTWLIGNGTNGWYKNKTHTDIYGLTSEFELGEIPAEFRNSISCDENMGTLTFDYPANIMLVRDFTIPVKLTVETPWSMSSAVANITFKPKTTIPASRQIHYTATAKVEPHATNVFGANIVSNEWNSATGQGVITFDADVTTIGKNAFSHCSGLTSITIPDSVTTIGEWAFLDCSSLTSITIPDSVTTIGDYAFGLLYLEAQNNQKQPEITKHKPLIINIF